MRIQLCTLYFQIHAEEVSKKTVIFRVLDDVLKVDIGEVRTILNKQIQMLQCKITNAHMHNQVQMLEYTHEHGYIQRYNC